MLSINNKSVNVDRKDMIQAIKAGLKIHEKEYNEAFEEYKAKVLSEYDRLHKMIKDGDFSNTKIDITPPADHKQDYLDVIEMMEVSVDQIISLDLEAYKAYYKNQWTWSRVFAATRASYK